MLHGCSWCVIVIYALAVPSAVRGLNELLLLVVVLYDYLLTLGDEVTSFWNGKLRAAHALFFLNRFSVVYFILTFTANAVQSDKVSLFLRSLISSISPLRDGIF